VTALAAVALAYLVGAIPVGYLVGRAFGVTDIRRHGSGNIGATNVLRTAGRLPAALTLIGDVVKGAGAVWLGATLAADGWAAAASAVAAIVGNCWSVFLGFRGGKGMATGLGAFLALVPWAVAPAALVWLVVVGTFRYVSLASIMSAVCVPLGALVLGYPRASVLACAASAAIVVARHRDNIARLSTGSERRLGERAR
jgi:acyl phosphate:glycerol-3-phosphate acyltransferase